MLAKPLLNGILADEALTRGLGDAEARVLVEWLVDRAEERATTADEVRELCRRGRAISRFVTLWCHEPARGAAHQLAATERFTWPLPTAAVDPWKMMQAILAWETEELRQRSRQPLAA
jgi:hypothetical protein